MSGGHFDYDQYKIRTIADTVETIILDNKRVLTDKELQEHHWNTIDLSQYTTPESRFMYNLPDEVIEEFKTGLYHLRMAEIYAQRIDWLMSGDDGQENFMKRLKTDIENYKANAERNSNTSGTK